LSSVYYDWAISALIPSYMWQMRRITIWNAVWLQCHSEIEVAIDPQRLYSSAGVGN